MGSRARVKIPHSKYRVMMSEFIAVIQGAVLSEAPAINELTAFIGLREYDTRDEAGTLDS